MSICHVYNRWHNRYSPMFKWAPHHVAFFNSRTTGMERMAWKQKSHTSKESSPPSVQHFEVFTDIWRILNLTLLSYFLLKHRHTNNKQRINISCSSSPWKLFLPWELVAWSTASEQWMEKFKGFQIASTSMPWTHIKYSRIINSLQECIWWWWRRVPTGSSGDTVALEDAGLYNKSIKLFFTRRGWCHGPIFISQVLFISAHLPVTSLNLIHQGFLDVTIHLLLHPDREGKMTCV